MTKQLSLLSPLLGTEHVSTTFRPIQENQNIFEKVVIDANAIPMTKKPSSDDLKYAARLEKIAAGFQKRIDFCFQTRTENTRKRISEGEHFRKEGFRLKEKQAIATNIAAKLRSGGCPPVLTKVVSKSQIEYLWTFNHWRTDDRDGSKMSEKEIVSRFKGFKGYQDVFYPTGINEKNLIHALDCLKFVATGGATESEKKEAQIRTLENALHGCDIPGFFPTPPNVIARLFEHFPQKASYTDFNILEPSAGNGNIADELKKFYSAAGCAVHCCEVNYSLRKILELKGHKVVGDDIMAHRDRAGYDLIVMNPPFENGQDCEHVYHCYTTLLREGGTLISVMGKAWTFNSQKKFVTFRDWFQTIDGEQFDIEEGSFAKTRIRSTGVSTLFIVLKK